MAKSQNSVVWTGLAEFQAALAALPDECQADALVEIDSAVSRAFSTIAAFYDAHIYTGTLRARLKITRTNAGLTLTSGSPLAWLFDNGSVARHYYTVNGVKKEVGRMPPTHIFSGTVGRERRGLTAKFAALLFRHGASSVTVT